MTLRDLIKEQLNQPHWTRGNPSGIIRASVDDLTTDVVFAVDKYLQQTGYEGLRKLIESEK
jgi:hypothetical protein